MQSDIDMIDETSNKTILTQLDGTNKDSNLPLIEKYRPKSLKDMVSHEEILNTINLFLEKKNIFFCFTSNYTTFYFNFLFEVMFIHI